MKCRYIDNKSFDGCFELNKIYEYKIVSSPIYDDKWNLIGEENLIWVKFDKNKLPLSSFFISLINFKLYFVDIQEERKYKLEKLLSINL